jgi:hypothetical protein
MPATRPTMREITAERHRQQRAAMELAVAENRLTVRQMTPAERKEADAHRAAHAARAAKRQRR